MTSAQALVLAGGGIAGIAWETGILRGIADESPAAARLLMDSDVLVGTSAGSAVAAQIATGCTLEVLFDRQVAETSAEIDSGVDIDTITGLFLTALQEPYDEAADKTRQQMRRIGAVAAGTETFPEAVRREVLEESGIQVGEVHYHSSQPWPFPGNIMLGFYGEGLSEAITIDPEEMIDVRWFSRDEISDPAAHDFALPRADSIARRLIEDWMATA